MKLKKWVRIICLCCIMLGMVFFKTYQTEASANIAEGTCGSNLKWSINAEGRLLISGVGEMEEFSPETYAPWYRYRDKIKEIKILNGVTSLGFGCFYDCAKVQTADFGSSLVRIGDYAFKECSGIEYITIPNSVKKIGDYAFYGCSELGVLSIPSNVEDIGVGAFASCTKLVSVTMNARITELKDYTFNNCSFLYTITLPETLEKIEKAAFDGCERLASIALPSNLKIIGESAFGGCRNLKSIVVPDNVNEIGETAFGNCSKLSQIILPPKLQTLGQSVFAYCTALEEIELPDSLVSLGMGIFMNCTALKKVEFPAAVSGVGTLAFWNCTSLESISFSGRNISLGEYMLRDCPNLRVIYGYSGTSVERLAQENACEFVPFDQEASYQVELYQESFVYDGTEKHPGILMKFHGTELQENQDYTVIYSNCKNAGTASVTITGLGRYAITINRTYTVARKPITELEVTVDKTKFTYDGLEKKPHITVKYGNRRLKENVDYLVSYQNNKNAGIAKAVVTGAGNYSGTAYKDFQITKAEQKIQVSSITKTIKSKPFYIKAKTNGGGKLTYKSSNPKVASINHEGYIVIKGYGQTFITIQAAPVGNYNKASKKVNLQVIPNKALITTASLSKEKKWKIKWKTDKTVTGYHVYISENKSFVGTNKQDVFEKYITKKDGKLTIGSLEKGKTYYLKIRAYKKVGKKKYFGSWSKVKRVKVYNGYSKG